MARVSHIAADMSLEGGRHTEAPRVRCTARRLHGTRGFTLIELLVVLVLIAMLSTAIVPSVASALSRSGIQNTGQKLCELLDFAYMSAVTRRCPVVLNVHPERRRCWVSMVQPSLPWLDESGEQGQDRVLATLALPEGTGASVNYGEESVFGANQSTAWQTITFQSDGRTDDVTIALTGPDGGQYLIQVLGATGEVHGEVRTP